MGQIINSSKLDHVDPTLKNLIIFLKNEFNSNATITSGARSKDDQIRIYKDKFGDDWEKHIAWNSAHLFDPGENLAQAIDFRIDDVFITKVHARLFDIIDMFKIKGIGLDIFHNYIHVDRKDRGRDSVLLWVYESNGSIVYL